MLGDVVKDIDAIYDLSAFTATLDIILSFAKVSFEIFHSNSHELTSLCLMFCVSFFVVRLSMQVSANQGFVCPTFGDEMRIVNAVHPLIEQNIHRTVPTPNNIVSASTNE